MPPASGWTRRNPRRQVAERRRFGARRPQPGTAAGDRHRLARRQPDRRLLRELHGRGAGSSSSTPAPLKADLDRDRGDQDQGRVRQVHGGQLRRLRFDLVRRRRPSRSRQPDHEHRLRRNVRDGPARSRLLPARQVQAAARRLSRLHPAHVRADRTRRMRRRLRTRSSRSRPRSPSCPGTRPTCATSTSSTTR